MKRFIVRYFGTLALLFAVFYLPTNPFAVSLNEVQTDLTLRILRLMLTKGHIDGNDIWIDPHYKIVVSDACNGFIPLFLFWSALIAFPGSLRRKLFWIITGYFVMLAVNSLRIFFVVRAAETMGGEKSFFWAHDIVGNVLLFITGGMMLVLYLRTRRK
jgi:exosortase/archaeosortase family protein